jgi:hypothetical protein
MCASNNGYRDRIAAKIGGVEQLARPEAWDVDAGEEFEEAKDVIDTIHRLMNKAK